jgi:hypothetical protein
MEGLESIGEDLADNVQLNTSRPVTGSAQLSTPALVPGEYSPAVDPDSRYGYSTASRPMPSLRRNLGNLESSQGLQQDHNPSYGVGMPVKVNRAGIPITGSDPQQNAEEEDDYYDDDTVETSARKLESLRISSGLQQDPSPSYEAGMQVMVNRMGIPIPRDSRRQSVQQEGSYYDGGTMDTSPPKSFTYSIPQKALAPSFPNACKIFRYLLHLDASR